MGAREADLVDGRQLRARLRRWQLPSHGCRGAPPAQLPLGAARARSMRQAAAGAGAGAAGRGGLSGGGQRLRSRCADATGGCRGAERSAAGALGQLAAWRSMLPVETAEPRCTCSASMTPASGDGTSMVAFSVSSVSSGVSTCTLSPTFTSTSMTATSLKAAQVGHLNVFGGHADPFDVGGSCRSAGDRIGLLGDRCRGSRSHRRPASGSMRP